MSAIAHVAGEERRCLVLDLSPGGAKLEFEDGEPLDVGTEVVLALEQYGSISADVRFAEGGKNGIMFIHETGDEARLARYLLSLQPPRNPVRHAVATEATVTSAAGVRCPCFVESISRDGAGILADEAGQLGEDDEVVLSLAEHGDIAATVRHVDGRQVGLEFRQKLDAEFPVS